MSTPIRIRSARRLWVAELGQIYDAHCRAMLMIEAERVAE